MTQKLDFGFKTLDYENLYTLYTGKIRIKHDLDTVKVSLFQHPELRITQVGNYTVIAYVTTDYDKHMTYQRSIGKMMHTICLDRLNDKYQYCYASNPEDLEL